MAADEVWKDARKFTVQIFKEFGLGNLNIENYVDIEVESFIKALKVKIFKFKKCLIYTL